MPLYFAYGANLDTDAMRDRCPGARPLGPARLANHRFHIMPEGVASVRREAGAVVHGLLWQLAAADVAPLDLFEEVGTGLYRKTTQPVLKPVGSVRAFLYLGHTAATGAPLAGYLEAVLEAAAALDLPIGYRRELESWAAPRPHKASPRDEAHRHPWS